MFNDYMYNIIILSERRYKRKELLRKLGDYTITFIDHMFKIFTQYDNIARESDWYKEIYNYYNQLPEIKTKSRKLKENDIFKAIFSYSLESFHSSFLKNIKNINSDFSDNLDINDKELEKNIYNFIKDYVKWLSSELATNMFISSDDSKNKLDELYIKYK